MARLEDIVITLNENDGAGSDPIFSDDVTYRRYVGASNIGHACERNLALRLRGYPTDPIGKSKQRIFDDGHRIESVVMGIIEKTVEDIEGVRVIDHGELKDQRSYTAFGGICRAHSDGILEFTDGEERIEWLVEAKSANDGSYASTVRLGMKYAHPEYYDQMQLMMGLGNMKHGLFIMYNKNDSQVYSEAVAFELFDYNFLLQRIEHVAGGNDEKCAKSSADFRCNLCSYVHVCWLDYELPKEELTCRHCIHSTMDDSGNSCQCNHPMVVVYDVEFDYEREVAQDCDYFTDYREKDK